VVLPSLTEFYFKGDSEYLEDVVGRIDAPALESVAITFFNQLVFNTPRLRDLFRRTEVFQKSHRADVFVNARCIDLTLFRREGMADRRVLEVTVSCSRLEWQLSALADFCSTSLPPLSTLECLSIHGYIYTGLNHLPTDDMESSQWLELLHPFVAVRDLVLPFPFSSQVATTLRELTGNVVTEMLPALRRVFIDPFGVKPIEEAFAPFITARQLSGLPVSVHYVERGGP
jgi:hypothetical protein